MESINSFSSKRFRYNDFIEPFKEGLPLSFTRDEEILFWRTCYGLIPTDKDMLPVAIKNKPEVEVAKRFSAERAAKSTIETKNRRLKELALSINSSAEEAFKSAIGRYNKLVETGADEDALQACINDRGQYILCFKFTPLFGVMEDFIDGHSNFLPYQGVELIQMQVKEAPSYFIDYKNNSYRELGEYDESDN